MEVLYDCCWTGHREGCQIRTPAIDTYGESFIFLKNPESNSWVIVVKPPSLGFSRAIRDGSWSIVPDADVSFLQLGVLPIIRFCDF